MQLLVATCVLTVLSIWFASGQDHQANYDVPIDYKYDFGVNDAHTGNKKWHYEVRKGNLVEGAYSLTEPDGTVRIVEYVAGPRTGFTAVVKRLGDAHHPQNYGKHYGRGEAYSKINDAQFDYHSDSE